MVHNYGTSLVRSKKWAQNSTYAAICARLATPGGVRAGHVGFAAATAPVGKLDHQGLIGTGQGSSIKQRNDLLAPVPTLHPEQQQNIYQETTTK